MHDGLQAQMIRVSTLGKRKKKSMKSCEEKNNGACVQEGVNCCLGWSWVKNVVASMKGLP